MLSVGTNGKVPGRPVAILALRSQLHSENKQASSLTGQRDL